MTLDEAFAEIECLPANERLLIGRLENAAIKWAPCNLNEIGGLNDIDYDFGLGVGMHEAIDDFRDREAILAVMIARTEADREIILAMGPESIEAVVECFLRASEGMARRQAH